MPNGEVTPDPLTRAIELVQDRIKRDLEITRPITGANEDRTRTFLINPLLEALGWSDPLVLTTQYLVRYGLGEYEYRVPDYALHLPDDVRNPIAFLEAKRMNEPLTSDHRKRLFEAAKYARNKGVEVQYCILTNGDRWDLYKPDKGSYLPVFSLLISEKSASGCAQTFHKHFPTPPTLETAGIATPTEAPTSDPDAVILSGWDREVDVSKVLAYFLSFLFLSSVYASFLNLWLNFNNTGLLRDIVYAAVGVGYTIVFVYALFFLQPDKALSRYLPLSKPINGQKKRLITWYWVAIAVVFGVGIGGASTFLLMNSLNDLMSDLSDLNIWLPPLVLLLVYVLIFWVPPLLVRLSRNKKKSQ